MDIFAAAHYGLDYDARWRLANSATVQPEVPPPSAAGPISVWERPEMKGPVEIHLLEKHLRFFPGEMFVISFSRTSSGVK